MAVISAIVCMVWCVYSNKMFANRLLIKHSIKISHFIDMHRSYLIIVQHNPSLNGINCHAVLELRAYGITGFFVFYSDIFDYVFRFSKVFSSKFEFFWLLENNFLNICTINYLSISPKTISMPILATTSASICPLPHMFKSLQMCKSGALTASIRFTEPSELNVHQTLL